MLSQFEAMDNFLQQNNEIASTRNGVSTVTRPQQQHPHGEELFQSFTALIEQEPKSYSTGRINNPIINEHQRQQPLRIGENAAAERFVRQRTAPPTNQAAATPFDPLNGKLDRGKNIARDEHNKEHGKGPHGEELHQSIATLNAQYIQLINMANRNDQYFRNLIQKARETMPSTSSTGKK